MSMTFHTKPLLQLYRYFFLFILVGLPLGLGCLAFDQSIVKQTDIVVHLLVCLILAVSGCIIVHCFFWEKFFAKLVFSNVDIRWKCPFRKTIVLSTEECNYIGVQLEESSNGLAYPFIFLSQRPYPTEYFSKINKLSCKEGFIKFWYSAELCNYIVDCFPTDKTAILLAYRKAGERN